MTPTHSSNSKSQVVLWIFIVLGIIAAVNVLGTRYFKRFDLTEQKEYSISPATKQIVKDLDDIINIKVYFSKKLPDQFKRIETDVRDILSEYKAYAGRNLRISWEDPGKDEKTKQKVRNLGIPEVQMQEIKKSDFQVKMGYLGIAVLFADKKEVIPVVQDMRNFEYDLTQAVLKVSRSETPKIAVMKTDTAMQLPPQIARQMGRSPEGETEEKFKPVFENLRRNFDVTLLDLSEGKAVDPSYRTLIVPGGEEGSFTERELFEIDQFLMKGGNLIVMVDPIKINFQYGVSGANQNPKIIKLLEHYGVKAEKKLIMDHACGQVQIPQRFGPVTLPVAVNYPYFVRVFGDGFNQENPAVSSLGEVILPWVSPLLLTVEKTDSANEKPADSSVVTAEVLMQSSEKSWESPGHFNLSPNQEWDTKDADYTRHNLAVHLSGQFTSFYKGKNVPPVREPDPGDSVSQIQMSPEDQDRTIVPQSVDAHLIVVGDSDFLTSQNAAPGNVAFLMNVVEWISQDRNLIGIRSRSLADRTISHDELKEGSNLPIIVSLTNLLLMPFAIIIFGLVVYFKRKNAMQSPETENAATPVASAGSDNTEEARS